MRKAGGLRGRTRAGRLDGWNALALHLLAPALRAVPEGLVVDVGIGDHAATVRELVGALREQGLDNPVVAVDADGERAARARAELRELAGVRVVHADLRALPGLIENALLVRAANVLRQAALGDLPALHAALTGLLAPEGRVLEGSTDREGAVSCLHVLGPGGARLALAFTTTLAGGFAPVRFRDHLPRDLRRRVRQTPALEQLFADWTAAFEAARASGCTDPATLFRRSVAATPALRLCPFASGQLGACWPPPTGVPTPLPETGCSSTRP